jgi:hypothetical protein
LQAAETKMIDDITNLFSNLQMNDSTNIAVENRKIIEDELD